MKRVLVVTGTPGVGKSCVSSLLASRLNGSYVNLGDLVKHEGLSNGVDRKRETLIADIERVSKRVREIIGQSEGYVIIDGHFAMDVVSAEDVFLAFVLRRNPDELEEILIERGFKKSKIMENIAAEILDVCLFDAVRAYNKKKVCEVDVSDRTVENVVDEIICVIDGRKKCRVGVVDWLTKLELEGRLNDFLDAF
ncbi:MAG: adenylate kinase family protein [Candidatus Bathyarchaeia archaeon]